MLFNAVGVEVRGVRFPRKQQYECVRFNVIRVISRKNVT